MYFVFRYFLKLTGEDGIVIASQVFDNREA